MYESRPVTNRIQHMRELIRDRVIRNDAERAIIMTEAHKKYEHVVPVIKKPLAMHEYCKKKKVRVEDFEVIVGNRGEYFLGNTHLVEWHGTDIDAFTNDPSKPGSWLIEEDGLYHNPKEDLVRLTISPDDVEKLRSVSDYWKEHAYTRIADAWQPDGYDDLCRLNVSKNVPGSPLIMMQSGHLSPGYKKIIDKGFGAIRKEAQDWIDEHHGNIMGKDTKRYLFYKSVVITCDAITVLIRRYGEACYRKAKICEDEERKKELMWMGDGLMWISKNPARTFWEALQLTALYQLYLYSETFFPGPAFGRIDQYTWPFLKADLESGRIDMDQAQEYLDAFFLKANCYYRGETGKLVETVGAGNTYQHTTIGGVDPGTNEDATNPVTYMVLASISRLRLHDPTISLRINKNTPEDLWNLAIRTSRICGGLPLFQNDDVIIPGLVKELGFELKDARDYCIIGCQEIVGSGNDYAAANGVSPPYASIHHGVVLDMAINNGINPFNNEQCEIHRGYLYEMETIDDVKNAYREILEYVLKLQVSVDNYVEYIIQYNAPEAGLSVSMDGCMEKGMDATWGGCKYNSYGGTASGLATIADSLTAIRYMVFDKKLCTARELLDAVLANWEGHEDLRQRIINEAPHFGNADPYADEMMQWVIDTYYDVCKQCHSERAKVYKAGLYSAADHVGQGYTTWATPDGRRTGEPIADAASPVQGRDQNGPTAVCLSSVCYDHKKFMDGVCVNIKIHPTALRGEEGIAKLRMMTQAYFNKGGLEIQYNIVDTDTMRAAQADPATYRDLVVRIAGFSAYFVELGLDNQNDLISRTENMLS
jgi:pyruvate formate-lyase/glycerol dehydratase family glycyl radical enzyme